MAHIHSVYDNDVHFSIDPITRAIRNDSTNAKTKISQYDHNSERLTFDLPRYIDGHDMSTCNRVRVHYINIGSGNKADGVYEVDDLQVSPSDENVVICSWLISQNATQYVGSLNFLVRFMCMSDGATPDYVWNTAIYSAIAVIEGIDNSEVIVEEYADILEQWRQELIASGGGVSDEQIAQAVADYMAENPVEGNVTLDTTLTKSGQAADAKATGDAINKLSDEIENLPSDVSGLTSAQISALDGLFKIVAYTGDPTTAYEAFKTAFGLSGDSGGDDSGGDTGGGDTETTYSVTNNLTNVTTDNSTTEISGGSLYTANLTADEGYTISSVVITMGGEDISASAYGDGVISIDAVTGDVIITAIAEQMHTDGPVYQLAEETAFGDGTGYDTGYALFNDLTKDITVACEISITKTGSEDVWWSCTAADKYTLVMRKRGGYFNSIQLNKGAAADFSTGTPSHLKVVIVLEPSSVLYATVYYASSGALASAQAANGMGGFKSNPDATINFSSSDTAAGTMHDFKVYERALVESEIKAYLGVE